MNEQQDHELARRARSFRYAFSGCWFVLRTQPNAWIHSAATIAVIGLGLWLRLPRISWAALVLAMTLVWSAEFFNTAIESVVDLASPDPHGLAEIAKDVAAGAVLVSALGSVIVGLLILGPPLWARLVG